LKILLDTCVWGGTKVHFEAAGHDVIWSGDWEADPGDDEILAIAHREGRILVTLDKDFGELAIVHNKPHSGIIRLVNIRARQQGTFCLHVLEQYQNEILNGAIVTVETDRVRIRITKG
jgi:predicted nuclease of predicted toxin-antitoxin system